MYIEKLKSWSNKDWRLYFNQYKIYDIDVQREVRQILTWNKECVDSNFDKLTDFWIINWIWSSFFPNWLRWIITILFKGVRFWWHDIDYWIGWDTKDYYRANYWLLKYSFKTIDDNILKFNEMLIPLYTKVLIIAVYLLSLIITVPIIIFCYILVTLFWWTSFRFTK